MAEEARISKTTAVIVSPKIKKVIIERPANGNRIFNEVDYEVIRTSYSGRELVILISRDINEKNNQRVSKGEPRVDREPSDFS